MQFLKPGDTIGVIAPSGSFDPDRLHRGAACLENMGFSVHIPEDIFGKKRYLAGEDQVRAQVVNRLFANPDIKGIIAARGGFGAMRILDGLDFAVIKGRFCPVMGFSDTTALFSVLVDKANIPVIHGPNLVSLASANVETLESFFRVITGDLQPLKAESSLGQGRATGVFKGGNLSTLCHLAGTCHEPDFTDAVVFLEDVNEPAYKIDRMLYQMKMAGLFDHIRGVVTGEFSFCDRPHFLPQIFEEVFLDRDIPVLMGIQAGHGDTNLSFPLGQKVSIDTSSLLVSWEVE